MRRSGSLQFVEVNLEAWRRTTLVRIRARVFPPREAAERLVEEYAEVGGLPLCVGGERRDERLERLCEEGEEEEEEEGEEQEEEEGEEEEEEGEEDGEEEGEGEEEEAEEEQQHTEDRDGVSIESTG